MVAWRKLEESRKQENEAKRHRYREAIKNWEAAKAKARAEKKKFGQVKPKMEKLASPIPKPLVFAHEPGSSDDEDSEDDEDEDGLDE